MFHNKTKIYATDILGSFSYKTNTKDVNIPNETLITFEKLY